MTRGAERKGGDKRDSRAEGGLEVEAKLAKTFLLLIQDKVVLCLALSKMLCLGSTVIVYLSCALLFLCFCSTHRVGSKCYG